MFDFETPEQREAWRVIRPLLVPKHNHTFGSGVYPEFDEAAARFDAREARCGIKPLSSEHLILTLACRDDIFFGNKDTAPCKELEKMGFLIYREPQNYWDSTREGRAELDRLNAMCKVQS